MTHRPAKSPARPSSARHTKARLSRVEGLLAAAGYEVRYERGHFRAGACQVHARRVVVVNRYFDAEARLRALESVVSSLGIDPAGLDAEADRALLHELLSG